MEWLTAIFITVLAIEVSPANIPIENLISGENEKVFQQTLEQHISSIQADFKPFKETLEKKGCRTIFDQNEITKINKKHFDIDACVNLTYSIADSLEMISTTYHLSNEYKNLTLDALRNVTSCLSLKDRISSSICTIDTINLYGAEYGELNENLKSLLLDEQTIRKSIYYYYNECFGKSTTELRTIAEDYSNKLCL